MKLARHAATIAVGTVVLIAGTVVAQAEILEEIIAWVNGEIITRSAYDEEEEARTAEAYRQFSGEELDETLEQMREKLLLSLIDRKILLHQAKALGYDLDQMGDSFLVSFMKLQNYETMEEVEALAKRDGMTLDDVKTKLIGLYGPDEVIRYEVSNRISISDAEIEAFHTSNPDNFRVGGDVTLREIVLLAQDADAKAERRAEA